MAFYRAFMLAPGLAPGLAPRAGVGSCRHLAAWLAAIFLAVSLAAVPAQAGAPKPLKAPDIEGFASWLADFRAQARRAGIPPGILDRALGGIRPNPRVVALDRMQPEDRLSFDSYAARVVTEANIARGARLYQRHRRALDALARETGVPGRMIIALWGMETRYGAITGGFDVPRALATLAWDGRRGAYFRAELMAAMKILDAGHIEPEAMTGSWAGAMGQPQFMPSSFRHYAVDGDGDGRADIWHTRADVFASAANYLAQAGWRRGERWGRPVRLPAGLDPALIGLETERPVARWAELGVRRADGGPLPVADMSGAIIQPDGEDGPAFLVYENFRVLMRWNRSTHFAATVGLLADAVVTPGRDHDRLVH